MNNDIRNLTKWLNEGQEAPIDRQALARVLAMAQQPAPATELREQEPKKDLMYSTVAMQERHAAFVDRAVATLEQAKREALAEQPAQQEFVCSTGLCYYKAQQQEPVAWLRKSDLVELRACNYMRLGADSPSIWAPNAPDEPSPDMELVAVYTSPPAQRTWVGLTDEDIASLDLSAVTVKDAISDVRAVEAKLKEKNA